MRSRSLPDSWETELFSDSIRDSRPSARVPLPIPAKTLDSEPRSVANAAIEDVRDEEHDVGGGESRR